MISQKFNPKFLILTLSWMTAPCFSTLSYAGIVLGGTRVVYPSEQKEVTVNVKNAGKQPVLAQSWIDNGEARETPDKITSPFVLTPPINRIDAGKGQTLRISLIDGKTLPQNKESLFYLNVLEIPAKSKNAAEDNHLSIAFRTRVKLFYRPADLPGDVNMAPDLLKWSVSNGGLKVTNNSVFYITLGTVTYSNSGKEYIADGQMVAPGSSTEYHFKNISAINDVSSITFTTLNDYGAVVKHKITH
jgi:chaperone protein EcpD